MNWSLRRILKRGGRSRAQMRPYKKGPGVGVLKDPDNLSKKIKESLGVVREISQKGPCSKTVSVKQIRSSENNEKNVTTTKIELKGSEQRASKREKLRNSCGKIETENTNGGGGFKTHPTTPPKNQRKRAKGGKALVRDGGFRPISTGDGEELMSRKGKGNNHCLHKIACDIRAKTWGSQRKDTATVRRGTGTGSDFLGGPKKHRDRKKISPKYKQRVPLKKAKTKNGDFEVGRTVFGGGT